MRKENIPLYIVAGGESRRFGAQDKARALVHGEPMLAHVARHLRPWVKDVMVISRAHRDYEDLGLTCISDVLPGLGPMGGLYTASMHCEEEWFYLVSCDWVHPQGRWLHELARGRRAGTGQAGVVFRGERWQPLFGLYRVEEVLPVVERAVERRQLALWRLLEQLHIRALPLPPQWSSIKQVNTQHALRGAYGEAVRAINPATNEVFGPNHTIHDVAEVERRLACAHDAFLEWRTRSLDERAALMHRLADLLDEDNETLARLMTNEMGKPIKEARSEVTKCAWGCRHYADHAERYLTPDAIHSDATLSMVRYDPLGAILAIMPWNFPLWQVLRFAAPTIMAGNVGILKHAPNTPGCAAAVEALFLKAGFPEGVFTNLFVEVERVESIIMDRRIAGVSLTGSVGAGKAVAQISGAACKPSLLELGGSDPFIVLSDADLEHTTTQAVRSRMLNGGQSCIAAKRFLVMDDVYDVFVEKLEEKIKALVQGDPHEEETQIGPMAREDLRQELHAQVTESVAQGASLRLGGVLPEGAGSYYPPTLLLDVRPGMRVFEEETFGPVAVVVRVKNIKEAVAFANSSEYGLGASIWTQDAHKALTLASDIASGCVAINGMVKSDPRLPFGGIKDSGYGRELGRGGILAFVNHKTIWMA